MTQSIFDRPAMNDPEQAVEYYCDVEDCAGYPTAAEHAALKDGAMALSDVLHDALDAYSKTHPDLTYDLILHALDCLTFCIRSQRDDEPDDA